MGVGGEGIERVVITGIAVSRGGDIFASQARRAENGEDPLGLPERQTEGGRLHARAALRQGLSGLGRAVRDNSRGAGHQGTARCRGLRRGQGRAGPQKSAGEVDGPRAGARRPSSAAARMATLSTTEEVREGRWPRVPVAAI